MRCWKRINTQGKTITVESYSHDLDISGAIEVDANEFEDFIASLPPAIPEPDLWQDINLIKGKLKL